MTDSCNVNLKGNELPCDDGWTRVCVGIATRGRPDQVASMLDNLQRQTIKPASIIICCSGAEDIGTLTSIENITILYERPGLARQRNAILQAIPGGTDYVVFFDDDFYPHPDWLRTVAQTFRENLQIVGITGNVVADGILGPGLSREEAMSHLEACDPTACSWVVEGYSPYGCNMAFRHTAIASLRFDERLVLYGWLEDRDFGAALAQRGGQLIKLGSAVGVHLGVKGGRVSGRRLGYSQVMNPVYMRWKGTMTSLQVVRQISRNIAANLTKSANPEPYIDRRGRLAGNMIAALDLLRCRLTPERASSL